MMHFEQTHAPYDPAHRTSPVYLVGADTRVTCVLFTGLILLFQGYSDWALVRSREALAAAYELSHAFATRQALYLSCWLHQIEPIRSFPPRLDTVNPVQSGRIADLLGHDHQGSVDRAV